jgi:DNA-binding CsgD family transcriptional regulator/PAS domain-containing protein
MDIENATYALIGSIYDAALAPEKWQDVMASFVKTVGTNTAILREVNYDRREVGIFKTLGFDHSHIKAYRSHFVHVDYFAPYLCAQAVGDVSCGDDFVPWEQQRNTEFYNDYLRPLNNRYCLGVTLANDQNHHLLFALQRTQQQGNFNEKTLQLIRTVAPHMTRAISIHRQMLEVTAQQQWALSALDTLKIGVILLNDQGKPCFINQKAEHLMSSGCGLSVSRNKLNLINTLDSACLEHFIADAAKAASGYKCRSGGSLRTSNLLGQTLYLQVIPLPRDRSERPWGASLASGCIAVFLSMSGRAHLRCEVLSMLYGFTAAESKLASLLADGLTLEHSANRLGISIQTVRSQLKAIFAKAQVSRQTELVARLLTDMLSHQLTD